MTLGELKEWAGLIGLISPVVAAAILWWLSTRFAAKSDIAELTRKAEEAARKLAEGETRFVRLEGAIREVEHAAGRARSAAEKAEKAAGSVHEAQLDIEELRGELKAVVAAMEPIKRFTNLMVEGHLKMGSGS